MPASTRSRVKDCSHTRSGIHIPRTVPRPAALRASGCSCGSGPTRSREGIIARIGSKNGPADDLDPRLRRPARPGGPDTPDGAASSHSISEPLVCRAIFSDGIAAEDVQEGPVAVLVGLLEDVFEIADGLVIVQRQNEANAVGHGRVAGR